MSQVYSEDTRRELYKRLNESGKDYGIKFSKRDISSNSRLALLLSEYAKATGSFDTLHKTLFQAYFEDGRDIGDREILMQLAEKSGLSQKDCEQAWHDSDLEKRLLENTAAAQQENATAVPTFIINDKYQIIGAQPYKVFQDIIKKIEKE